MPWFSSMILVVQMSFVASVPDWHQGRNAIERRVMMLVSDSLSSRFGALTGWSSWRSEPAGEAISLVAANGQVGLPLMFLGAILLDQWLIASFVSSPICSVQAKIQLVSPNNTSIKQQTARRCFMQDVHLFLFGAYCPKLVVFWMFFLYLLMLEQTLVWVLD